MTTRLYVVTEYSKGRTFEKAVENLLKKGLMKGSYNQVEVIDREEAHLRYKSWYNERESKVKYIVVEKYDKECEQWFIDYSEGIEILQCQ